MSQNAYSEMETGKTKIDIKKVFQLAEFYKIEPYDILSTPPRKKVF
jgi:transcriptional regulator with XRE-family HTH domain